MSNIRIDDVERLAAMFKALSNPQRLRMFVKLATKCCAAGDPCDTRKVTYCCAGEVGADLDLAASTVSHHLKELRQAGLMQVERRGQKVDCRVDAGSLRLLADFFESHSAAGAGGARMAPARRPAKGGQVQ